MTTTPIAAGGYILDIVGALTLASAFALKRPKDVRLESASYYDSSPYLIVSLAKQTADAWVGGALLTLGFGGQFAQSVGANPSWSRLEFTVPIAGGVAVAAVSFLIKVLRPFNVRRTIEHQLAADREKNRTDLWAPKIIWNSRALGREIADGERPADVARWLIGDKRWERVSRDVDLPEDVSQPYHPGAG